MLNRATIIGRLGRDPELKYSAGGLAICSMNIATDDSYFDSEGNKVERTEWHKVSVFQRQAENCANYLAKGSLVYVEGSLKTQKWQDQQGNDRYTTQINATRVQFLDRKQQNEGQGGYQPQQSGRNGSYQSGSDQDDLGPAFPTEASGMDDVPF